MKLIRFMPPLEGHYFYSFILLRSSLFGPHNSAEFASPIMICLHPQRVTEQLTAFIGWARSTGSGLSYEFRFQTF